MNDINTTIPDSNDIFSSGFLLGNLGAPFLIGMAVGYFAKKMIRIVLFIGGAMLVTLFLAEYAGIISINSDVLQNVASTAAESAKSSGGFLVDRLALISSRGVSSVGGFYVGFKLG